MNYATRSSRFQTHTFIPRARNTGAAISWRHTTARTFSGKGSAASLWRAPPSRRKAGRFPVSGCPSLPYSFQAVALENTGQHAFGVFVIGIKPTTSLSLLPGHIGPADFLRIGDNACLIGFMFARPGHRRNFAAQAEFRGGSRTLLAAAAISCAILF